jgi:disulfide bond formation protein DsbB
MAEKTSETLDIGLALLGSILMFAGWVLAIAPAFQHVKHGEIPLILGGVGFGVVLIPLGLDFLGTPREETSEKRGKGTLVVSLLPAVALFVIVVAVFPLSTLFRILAVAVEFVGMAAYSRAVWVYHHPSPASSGAEGAKARRERA